MATDSRGTTTAGVRDKRYAGQALLVDLHDAECEAKIWTTGGFTLADAPRKLLDGLHQREVLAGVFSFEGTTDHGLFEAEIEGLDLERGGLIARFVWLSERGHKLLEFSNRRPAPPMRLGLARITLNWSLSGLLLGGYRGALKDGERLNGMIWTDDPKDPGLFIGHVIKLNPDKHTLAVKFDELPEATFALLEATMRKRAVGFPPASAWTHG
ncbi:MAG TPA: hypothetical protein VMB81_08705 [Candidatus Sulfotelmatobacter sp.]|nr:hypothetical protein [Candidatus Sulfotelmatobacter sp.]